MGRSLLPKVLLTVFGEFPRPFGCTAAAMLPEQARGSFRKPIKKPSEQVAAPPSTVLADCHADHDRKWGSSLASFSGARAGWVLLKDFKFCFDGVLDERDFD